MSTRTLNRVEMDHSPLKVVVGFRLGFEASSYAAIMEALGHPILPKTYLKQ